MNRTSFPGLLIIPLSRLAPNSYVKPILLILIFSTMQYIRVFLLERFDDRTNIEYQLVMNCPMETAFSRAKSEFDKKVNINGL
jgi:hypothetical protein